MNRAQLIEWLRGCTHGRPTASGFPSQDGAPFQEAAHMLDRDGGALQMALDDLERVAGDDDDFSDTIQVINSALGCEQKADSK